MTVISNFFLNEYDNSIFQFFKKANFLKKLARNLTYLNLTGCKIIGDVYNNDLHFFGDELPPGCNEINNSYVSDFYRKGATEICFDSVSYTDYGSSNKTDKKTYSVEGEVRIF